MASTSAWFSAVPSRSSIFGSSGVRGLGMEASTASAIAGSQRYFAASAGSRSAEPVTAALPAAGEVLLHGVGGEPLEELDRARRCSGAPEAMPQMNVPMAGPLFSCDGVAAKSILPTTFDCCGSSTACAVPVYSVSAVQWPWSRSAVSSVGVVVGHARRHVRDELEQPLERAHALGPVEARRPVVVCEVAAVGVQERQVRLDDRVPGDAARRSSRRASAGSTSPSRR